jgi:hypothetical protein
MAFDYKNFAKDIGMAAEDETAMDALFAKYPGAATKIESVLTAQVEARLTPLKTEIETKQRDLDAQFETLAAIRTGDSDAVAAAEKRIELLSGQMATLQERVRGVARQAGIDPETVLKDLETKAPVVVTPKTNDFDPSKISTAINLGALNALEQAAIIEDLRAEHASLFPGKPFNGFELIQTLKDTVKRTGNTNLGLRDVFESKFNVSARRDELREQEVQQRIKDAVDKAKTEVNDANALRGSGDGVPHFTGSPLLESLRPKDGAPAVVNGVPAGVAAAVANYRKNHLAKAS